MAVATADQILALLPTEMVFTGATVILLQMLTEILLIASWEKSHPPYSELQGDHVLSLPSPPVSAALHLFPLSVLAMLLQGEHFSYWVVCARRSPFLLYSPLHSSGRRTSLCLDDRA